MRPRWRFGLALAVALPLLLGAGLAFLHSGPLPPPGGALVVVREGESLRTVAARLAAGHVIRSPLLFRMWARASELDRTLQPGEYRFTESMPLRRVLATLTTGTGRPELTVPEGFTVREVATLLARHDLGRVESFLCLAADPEFLLEAGVPGTGLEGYLFPDTYRFSSVMSPGEILGAMVRRFHDRFGAEYHRRARAQGMTVDQVVTLASMIEKETAVPGERPLISAVFRNRLRAGMRLQSDPTVIFALPRFDGNLTRADLSWPSPYNTYVVTGLPPGPIANPGLAALEAALAPAEASYLYFVSKNDGSHVFSTSLAEHNRAVARYQRHTPKRPSS